MTRLSDHELWEYIREDLPYLDLTTHLLELPEQRAVMRIVPRHEVTAACTEEAARIGELLGCSVAFEAHSGSRVEAGEELLVLEGDGAALHRAWRLCQVLLEYACGLATYAHDMLTAARAVNPHCEIFVTRKTFPFAKRFNIRALLSAGVLPHRLGLSETVLIFANHRERYPDEASFEAAFKALKRRCVEKKVVVESETLEDAKKMLSLGADVIQMDKCTPETVAELAAYRDEHHPAAAILAAGGVRKENVAAFAATGANALVTSRPYQAPAADLTAKWKTL